ncbi:MAG TPA: ABC transporter ATP-binding protein [Coxiellaceae bacterium]|nr:MAG: peptide ABC transporter ATP-binding protein [Gammaproteobacteria bacterium RIFCSPHIGHO2_12_FULL_36_30]HLB55995.1 ABC transporter ATP-binding protein [Coxiellaceae bacterium]
MRSPILTISNLSVSFLLTPVLNHFQLTLQRGQCMGLVGESGSGKTISALSILQLLPQTARVNADSNIIFREQNLLDLSEKQMRRVRGKHIGMIFQDAMSALNPVLTIGQQLTETIRLHLFFNPKEAKARALFLLEEVGINESVRCFQSYPHELSGGMRQRAMIAIAIAAEPEIIIADEPTTALDVTIQAQVLDLLNQLKKEKQCALLFIGHDLSVVSNMADDITVLKNGNMIEQSNAKQFFQHPQQEYSKQLFDAVLSNTPRKTAEEKTKILFVDHLKQYFPIRSGILKRVKNYVKAVDDISFAIPQGETVAIVGESGSGKTTTAKAILQLIRNTSGKIIFQNESLGDLSRSQLRKKRADMQIIFQDPYAALNPRMMIFDSLCEGLLIQKKIRNKKEAAPLIDAILQQVELSEDFKWRYPHEFSGGQRQRICIARALTLSPQLLILDEPTSALDVSTQKQILILLDRLQSEKKLSYLLITHNLSVVAYLAHYIAVMHQGKIVEYGSAIDVLQNPKHDYTKQLLKSTPNLDREPRA